MKLLSKEQIGALSKFKSKDFLTTSFYLDTDKSKLTKKEIKLSLKNLIRFNKSQLELMSLDKPQKESLTQDLININEFCADNLPSYDFAGLSIFSCSEEKFWQIINLPNSPRNRIIFDQNPYVRPLSAILDEYHRICVLTFDRREAKWYDIFMGDIHLLDSIKRENFSKTKEAGREGYESKRIETRLSTYLHEHFKTIANMTFDILKKNNFYWLFLGCKDEYSAHLEPLFHPYLKKRLRGRIKVKPDDSPKKALKEALELKNILKNNEEKEIVLRFVSELEKGGLAISGLKNTLKKLNRGEAQTLLITRNFFKPGRICPKCNFLFVDETNCPFCKVKTEPLVDVVDEAIEIAMEKKCQVKHINIPYKLRRYGNMGALLRYKT